MFDTIMSLQSREGGGDSGGDDLVGHTVKDCMTRLFKHGSFDVEAITMQYPVMYEESMNTVLVQECIRYNKLIDIKSINDSRPKQLYTPLCVIHMLPVKDRQPTKGGVYRCPVYKVLSRRGVLSTTGHSTNFIMWIEIPSNREDIKNFTGDADQAVWIMAGVAAFGSL